jgi:hypothetical protein
MSTLDIHMNSPHLSSSEMQLTVFGVQLLYCTGSGFPSNATLRLLYCFHPYHWFYLLPPPPQTLVILPFALLQFLDLAYFKLDFSQMVHLALPPTSFSSLHGLLITPENGGNKFLWNIWLSLNYVVFKPEHCIPRKGRRFISGIHAYNFLF